MHAGVSIATVSRVVNSARFVSAKTRPKVLDAIAALSYQLLVHVFRHTRTSHTEITPVVADSLNRLIQPTSWKKHAGKWTAAAAIQSRTGPISCCTTNLMIEG